MSQQGTMSQQGQPAGGMGTNQYRRRRANRDLSLVEVPSLLLLASADSRQKTVPPQLQACQLFPTDRPVPDGMIGRQTEVDQLAVAVGQGLHQVVAGPRRQGKTTLCKAVLAKLRDEEAYTVAVDLFALNGTADLARAIASGLVANRSVLRRGAAKARDLAQEATSTLSILTTATLQAGWGMDVEIALNPHLAESDPMGYLGKSIRLLQRAADADGKKVILFVDELQELVADRQAFGDGTEVTNLLSTELQQAPSVTCLFAGSQEHLMRDLYNDERRAFYHWGTWHELTPIRLDEWARGLNDRFAEGGRPITAPALQMLLGRSEGHVRTTMLLAQHSYLASSMAGADSTTVGHVEAAHESIMQAEAAAHAREAQHIQTLGRSALRVCRSIAREGAAYAPKDTAVLLEGIMPAEQAGYLKRINTTAGGGWMVPDPMLRAYLAQLGRRPAPPSRPTIILY